MHTVGNMVERNLFMPALPPVSPGLSSSSNKLTIGQNMQPQQVLSAAKGVYDAIPDSVKDSVRTQAQDVIRNRGNNILSGIKEGRPMRTGGNKRMHSSGYALTQATNPMPISLDTGVMPNTRVTDFMEADLGVCSPLHMTGAIFQFPNYSATALQSYMLNDIIFQVQTGAQRNIAFGINTATDFSSANVLNALNALVYALQILFYYKSIIAYFTLPQNNNQGMSFLRRGITPQLLEDLLMLERRLLNTPVPPNLLEFIRYLSGNFASGDMAGAPVLKIFPIAPSTTGIDLTAPATALANLSTNANNLVYTIMRRAVPHWVPKSLYDVPSEPYYDENFLTIWANLPFRSYLNAQTNIIPNVTVDTTPVTYASYTNALDGTAFSMMSIYSVTNSNYIPGLMVPTGSITANVATNTRLSYYTDGTIKQLYPSDTIEFLYRSRKETYVVNNAGTSFIAPHTSGTALCQNVNQSAIKETSFSALNYLMSLDQVKIDARNYHFPKQGGSSKGQGKRGKK